MTIGWIILGLTLGLPLVYVIVHFTYGRKWVMPKGTRVEGEYFGYHATLVYGKGADKYFEHSPQTIAHACALAAWSVGTLWEERRASYKAKAVDCKRVVVHVLDDDDYRITYDEKVAKDYNIPPFKSNGMLQHVPQRMGGDFLPLVACRASAFRSTPLTGSLVVHELTHHVLKESGVEWDGDVDHSSSFWYGHEGSFEREASERYVSKRKEIGITG